MPIAKFEADFSQFGPATRGAATDLDKLEGSSLRVAREIRRMGDESDKAAPQVTSLHGSLRQFDGILASLGLHVGPEIRALGELGDISSATAAEIGGITTAGLAFGAAIGGWKIGRAIADMAGLDKAIGDTAAKLFGMGDAAQEGAGAKVDYLARASATAGHEITTMSEAIFINEGALQKLRDASAAAAVEIDKLSAAEHARNAQNFTNVANEIGNAAKLRQLEEDLAAAQTKRNKDYLAAIDAKNAKAAEVEAAARRMGEAGVKAEEQAGAATAETNEALAKQKALVDEIAKANRAMGGSFQITRENAGASAAGLGADSGLVEQLLKKGYSFQQALLYSKHPEYPPPENIGPRVPGFYAGVQNFGGGMALVGERGPELVNLPKGSSITPMGGGGGTVVNNFYVNGTAVDVVRQIETVIMRQLKFVKQFGSA
jgi:hypothetical protein